MFTYVFLQNPPLTWTSYYQTKSRDYPHCYMGEYIIVITNSSTYIQTNGSQNKTIFTRINVNKYLTNYVHK